MTARYRRLVNRLLLLTALASLATGGAALGKSGAPPALTLTGPAATHFGHVVDFRGRLTPSLPGAQIRLYSSRAYVGATRLRRDGTYRFRVTVGRPGPFRTVWRDLRSRPVVVRVRPTLHVELLGSRVAGRPLSVAVRLRPEAAGRVRVRVLRGARLAYGRILPGAGRVRLSTRSLEPLRVAVESEPAKGYMHVSDSLHITLLAPSLSYGSRDRLVAEMLRRLDELHYVTPSPRVVFDGDVLQSVYAFEKAQGLARTGVADAEFWRRLDSPQKVAPRFRVGRDHLEIDKSRQILLVVRGGRVTLVVPVSTAGIAGYYTPEGRFAIGTKIAGYHTSPLGVLYKPMYFYGGYAIHGNPSVPPYPASHGCVRVPNFVIDRLFVTEPYGEPVIVYS